MMLTLRVYSSFDGLKQGIDSQLTFLKETTGLAHKPLLPFLEDHEIRPAEAQDERGSR